MKNKFIKHLKEIVDYKNCSFLLAISGGVDSMVLFNLFKEYSLNFSVAHCNFLLRGKSSDDDELFVKEICERFNHEVYLKKFDTKKIASKSSVSIQMAARKLRYNWFSDLLNKHKFDYLVTAHHFNDSVETIFLNIARGTGITGLKGIPIKENKTIRPLLIFTKNEIIDFAKKNRIKFRNDISNNDLKYRRNRVRKLIIPEFKNLNPGFFESIKTTLNNFQSVKNIYSDFIHNEKKRCCISNGDILIINIKALMISIEPKTVLFEIVNDYGFKDIDSIYNVIDSQSGKSFYSKNYLLIRDRDNICISKLLSKQSINITDSCTFINHPVKMTLQLTNKFNLKDEKIKSSAILSYNKLKFPLTIRNWESGDWFIPSGMKGKKKLSDYFIDNKFSLIEKQKCYVLCSNKNIVWIVGHRVDERYKFVEGEEKAYICRIN